MRTWSLGTLPGTLALTSEQGWEISAVITLPVAGGWNWMILKVLSNPIILYSTSPRCHQCEVKAPASRCLWFNQHKSCRATEFFTTLQAVVPACPAGRAQCVLLWALYGKVQFSICLIEVLYGKKISDFLKSLPLLQCALKPKAPIAHRLLLPLPFL